MNIRAAWRLAAVYLLLVLASAAKQLVYDAARLLLPAAGGVMLALTVGGMSGCPSCEVALALLRRATAGFVGGGRRRGGGRR